MNDPTKDLQPDPKQSHARGGSSLEIERPEMRATIQDGHEG